MRVLEAEGVRFLINPCKKGCGKVCSDEEAIAHLRRWDRLLDPCSFCGKPIRPRLMEIDHVHRSKVDEEGWGVTYGKLEYEPHYDWSSHGPFGLIDVHAHVRCAEKGMPYANFERIEYGRPDRIPEGEPLPKMTLQKCKVCGEKPTLEDAKRVAGRVYSFHGPCVYCNKPIRVLTIDLFHGSLDGKHLGLWHFKNYSREGSLTWWGYRFDNHERLEFHGHIYCAIRAMRYVKWQELDYVLDYWSTELLGGRNLEEISDAKKKLIPELANPGIRRHMSKVVAKQVQELQRITVEQIDFLVRKELYDLREGPREWIPGLAK